VKEVWSNKNHNTIIEYLSANHVEYGSIKNIEGYRRVRCIMALRETCDLALSQLEMDYERDQSDNAPTALEHKAQKENIRRQYLYPHELEDVDDLDETIDGLEGCEDYENVKWDVRWEPVVKTKKKKTVKYGSSKK
jgi:hypothetical protein